MWTSGVTALLHRLCADTEVPPLYRHQFRHTAAHQWLAVECREGDLMTNMNWRSRSMLDTYARATQAERACHASRHLAFGDRV